MAATRLDIMDWFQEGQSKGATHMIIMCDTYDHEDYPAYVMYGESAKDKVDTLAKGSMQRVMEVYNLNKDMVMQLNQPRSFEY